MRHVLPVLAICLLLAGCFTPDGGRDAGDGADANASAAEGADADAMADLEPEPVAMSFFERPAVGVPPTTMGITPASLDLQEDKPYLLQLTNDGQAPHDLVIEGLDVDTDTFGPGDTLEVEILPQEKGEYAYYCSVGGDGPAGHRAQGMEGVLTVA